MDDICETTHVASSLHRKSPLRRRGVAACLNWRWFCINFWPPQNARAVGTEMIDNYYYLRQEYTRCRISESGAGGEISLGGRLSRIRGFAYSQRIRPAIPSSDSSHRANYLITAADQSSELIESSLFSGHHCDEFAPPVVIGNYARFNFFSTMNRW